MLKKDHFTRLILVVVEVEGAEAALEPEVEVVAEALVGWAQGSPGQETGSASVLTAATQTSAGGTSATSARLQGQPANFQVFVS